MEKYQQLELDLSGIKGLANRFYGDKNLTASQPNLRYLGGDGQIAEGVYNPISTLGYMSPSNNTTKVCTGTTGFLLSSGIVIPERLVDASTDAIFFGDEAETGTSGKVVNLDTAIDTSLDTTMTFSSIQNPPFSFNFSSAVTNFIRGFIIKPSGSAFPSLNSWKSGEDSSGNTHTISFTIPAGLTNSVLIVSSFGKGSDTFAGAGCTWAGGAIDIFNRGSGSVGAFDYAFATYYKVNPDAGTSNIVVTWTSDKTDMVTYIMLYENAAQATPLIDQISEANEATTSSTIITPAATADYQTKIMNVYTWTTSSITPNFQGGVEVNTEEDLGAGTHALYTYSHNTQYFRIEDFIKYQVNGVPKIFFAKGNSLKTAPINDVGIADTDFTDVDDDWLTTTPNGFSPNILIPQGRTSFVLSDNGFLYVLNGNRVHKIDGGITGGDNGTVTRDILLFLGSTDTQGTSITYLQNGIDLRGKLWLGLHIDSATSTSMSGKSIPQFVGVYVWNRASTVASMQDFIPIVGVKELKSLHIFQGQPACFTISIDGYTQFRVWNGTEFKVVKTLGQNAYPMYSKHSVHENGENIMWLGNDGKIYCYGKIEEGLDNTLYILGDMSLNVTAGQTYSGSGVFIAANAVETVTTGNQTSPLAFYLSYKDTAGNHLRKWYPYSTDTVATVEQKGHIGNVYTMVKYLPDMSDIKYIDIRCAPTGTGSTVIATIKYYFNGSSTVGITKTITKDQASRGYVRHELNKPYCNAIQMEIEFSTTNTLGSANDFRPSIAVVNYKDTNTKG